MVHSVRFNDNEQKLIEFYAKLEGVTISELIRRSVMESIEDKVDIEISRKAVSYRHAEACRLPGSTITAFPPLPGSSVLRGLRRRDFGRLPP